MTRKKIAIVAGGDSGEYDVSIKSAAVVRDYLDKELFEPYLIVIRGGVWKYTDDEGFAHLVNKDDFSLETSNGKVIFDGVFNAIHGTPGEDGKLQGYLDLVGIPYTGCGLTVSSLTFNKYLCSRVAASLGFMTSPSVLLRKGDDTDIDNIIGVVGLPCFVKPNSGGSSVGMSKVREAGQLQAAIELAFMEDAEVLVEAFIPGREITCGLITHKGKVLSLPITEIIPANDFFDYEAKYTDGKAQEITPGNIPGDVARSCQEASEYLYRSLDCKGMVRIDYIFNERGLFFLEVNTVPGLSPNSIVPQQARAAGISLTELFTAVLEPVVRP